MYNTSTHVAFRLIISDTVNAYVTE
jgi:hypothetical protein